MKWTATKGNSISGGQGMEDFLIVRIFRWPLLRKASAGAGGSLMHRKYLSAPLALVALVAINSDSHR